MKFPAFLVFFYLLCFQLSAQETFNLEDCIDYGLHNHGTITIANNGELAADAAAKETFSGYLPKVSLNGNLDDNLKVQEQVIPAGVFGEEDVRVAFTKQFNTTATVELEQKIYDHSLIIDLKSRKFKQAQAKLETQQTKEDLIYTISSDYYQVMVYKLQLLLLNENKETYAEQVRISELQVEKGVLAKVDLKKVRVDYNSTLSQIRVTQNNLTNSINTLKNDIGYPVHKSLQVEEVEITPNDLMAETPTTDDFQPENRIEYQLDSINTELLKIDYRSTKNSGLPKLSAYANYGTVGFGDKLEESFNSQQSFSAIGLRLSANLFEGFGKTAKATQAKIKYENAKEQQKLDMATYKMEVANASSKLISSKTNVEEELENTELAQSVFNTTDLQYQKGVASLRDWLEDQLSLQQAQNNYLNAVVDFYVATLEFEKSKGTLKNYYNTLNEK